MMAKKIYFVAESTVSGEVIQSEKFNQFVNPDTGKTIFEDIFQITECRDFEKYKLKGEFLATALAMAYDYYDEYGEVDGEIHLIAIDEKTDVFQWGVKMEMLDDDSFKYTPLNYKVNGQIFKFEEKKENITMEEREIITMAQLEDIMTSRENAVFDASSVDTYSLSVDLVCTGAHFDKVVSSGEYLSMILMVGGSEIQIRPEIIEEIYLDKDGTITIEFTENLPDLEIKYRD